MGNTFNEAQVEHWEYDSPPTIFDLIQNNFFSNAVRTLLHVWIREELKLYHRFKAYHTERLRGLKSAILAANHASHLDVVALFSAFPLSRINNLRSLAAKDYFFRNSLKRTAGFFFANVIPVDRHGISSESIGFCGRKLREGYNLIVFPEGTRTPDGKIHNFRPGVGLLALKFNSPVVPVYINGTYECQRKGMFLPRPRKIEIYFGEPVNYQHLENNKSSWQYIASDLEERVKQLRKGG